MIMDCLRHFLSGLNHCWLREDCEFYLEEGMHPSINDFQLNFIQINNSFLKYNYTIYSVSTY